MTSVYAVILAVIGAAILLLRAERRGRRIQRDLAAREQDLTTTLNSIGDAVIATDARGHVVRMNQTAERLTAWTVAEARGRSLQEIFPIFHEESRIAIESPVQHVLREGHAVGLPSHTLLIARDGREYPIADSAAPILDDRGTVRGVVIVFRDVTFERAAEHALRDSEEKYRDLYENSPDMYALISAETGQVIECNQTLTQRLGYAKEEIVGRAIFELYQPNSKGSSRSSTESFQRTGEMHDVELQFRRKDGSSLDVSLGVTAVRDANGRILQSRCVWRDITARKQAERDQQFLGELGDLLRLSSDPEAVLFRIVETLGKYLGVARCLVSEIDEEGGTITIGRDYHHETPSMSGTMALSQFSRETSVDFRKGHTVVIYDVGRDTRIAKEHLPAYRRIGVGAYIGVPVRREGRWVATFLAAETSARRWEPREITLIQQTTERTWIWVEHLRVLEALRKQEAAEAVRRTEERFRLIVEGVKDHALFMIDPAGRIETWNAGAERLTGYAAEEAIGQPFAIFFPEDDPSAEGALLRASFEGRCEEEGWRVRKDGSRFWANAVITAIRDPGGALIGFGNVTRDFSERRAAEEKVQEKQAHLSASLKEREVLLQEIHHRVKNNLQVVSSLINMQLRQLHDEKARSALEECKSRVQAIALIHEKLYQSKDYAHVPFSAYAESLLGNIFYATGAATRRVRLETDIDSVRLAVDKAIPCGLILNELITNALKHAFPDGREGAVRIALKRLDGDRIALDVRDDGVGMSGDPETKRTTSLGMQLVTTLVEQLDGKLDVDAEPGKGTAFRVTFPAGGPA